MKRGAAREKRPGVWELRVFVGRDPITGRRRDRYRTVAASGRQEADNLLAAFVAEVLPAGPTRARRRTVGDLLESWLLAGSAEWAPSTTLNVRYRIDGPLSALAELDVLAVDSDTVTLFYRRLRDGVGRSALKPSTIARIAGDLSRAFEFGVARGFGGLTENPCRHASVGRQHRARITPPSPDAVLSLLRAAEARDPELLCFVVIAAETGARQGEIAALRLTDVRVDALSIERDLVIGLDTPETRAFYEGRCWPSKTSRGTYRTMLIEDVEPKNAESVRTIALAPVTLAEIREQAARLQARASAAGIIYPADGFLFPSNADGTRPIRPDTWKHRFRALAVGAGLESVRFHDLRHFVATSMLTAGVDLATAAGRLGHGGGGKTTLAIYAAFMKEPDRAASDVMAQLLTPTPDAETAQVIPIGRRRPAGPAS